MSLNYEMARYTELTGQDGTKVSISRLGGYLDGYEKGRAEAIDEVVNLYEKWTKLEKPQQAYYWTVVLCKLKEIAEQLKEKNNAID